MQKKALKPQPLRRSATVSPFLSYKEAIVLQDIIEVSVATETNPIIFPSSRGDLWIKEFIPYLEGIRGRVLSVRS